MLVFLLLLFHKSEINTFLWLSIVITLQNIKFICQSYEMSSCLLEVIVT